MAPELGHKNLVFHGGKVRETCRIAVSVLARVDASVCPYGSP
jgi:hypothetical protein